jgi:hypothetical protein
VKVSEYGGGYESNLKRCAIYLFVAEESRCIGIWFGSSFVLWYKVTFLHYTIEIPTN